MQGRQIIACLAALVLVPAPQGMAQTAPKEPGAISREMRTADPRLETRIALSEPRIRLGKLLEKIAKATGVQISADAKDGTGDVYVQAYCTELPLADVMNGLWALVSYRKGEWEWELRGTKARPSYRLAQPPRARSYSRERREWMVNTFRQQALTLIGAVDGSDAQRAQALKQIYGDAERPEIALTPERIWSAVRLVKQHATAKQLMRALDGEAVNIRTDGAASAAHAGAPDADLAGDHTLTLAPASFGGVPILYAGLVSENLTPIAGSVPLARAYRNSMYAAWLMDGDAKDDPASLKPVGATRAGGSATRTDGRESGSASVVQVPPGEPEGRMSSLELRMQAIAVEARQPMFVRLREDQRDDMLPDPVGHTISEYWKALWGTALGAWFKDVMPKWRGGVLLVTTISWPMDDDPIPERILAALRRSSRPGEYLPIADVAAVADVLTPRQLARLVTEFPVMDEAIRCRGMLILMHRYPDLIRQAQSPTGVPLTPEVLDVIHSLPASPLNVVVDRAEARYLAITEKDSRRLGKPTRAMIFWALDKDGRQTIGTEVANVRQPTLEEQKERAASDGSKVITRPNGERITVPPDALPH